MEDSKNYEIYAFYEKKGRPETLFEHVNTGLGLLDSVGSSKISDILSPEDLEWLKLAWILHDSGKLFYQCNFTKSQKKLSFRGHEYFSAYLADKLLNLWIESNLSEENLERYSRYRLLVVGAILYHHHAMGLRSRALISRIRAANNKEDWLNLLKSFRNNFYEKIRNATEITKYIDLYLPWQNEQDSSLETKNPDNNSTKLDLSWLKDVVNENGYVDTTFLEDVIRYVNTINIMIWRSFAGDRLFRRKFLAFEAILIAIDNEVAMKNREENYGKKLKSSFIKAIEDFSKIYLSPKASFIS
jgi:CRISPR-associated endonuclease Cas3-HD